MTIYKPLEVAISRHDEVAHLLVAVGADVNAITGNGSRITLEQGRSSILDYVTSVSAKLSAKVAEQAQRLISPSNVGVAQGASFARSPLLGMPLALATSGPTPVLGTPLALAASGQTPVLGMPFALPTAGPTPMQPRPQPMLLPGSHFRLGASPSWTSEWRMSCLDAINKCNNTFRKNYPVRQHTTAADYVELKRYFDNVEALLRSHGAKTAVELDSAEISESARKQTLLNLIHMPYEMNSSSMALIQEPVSFWRLQSGQIGPHTTLSALYEELYAACWNGDNLKIQELCLPQTEVKRAETPLVISARWGDQWCGTS